MEVAGPLHSPTAVLPKKPLNTRLDGPKFRPERFGEEISRFPQSQFEIRFFQSVVQSLGFSVLAAHYDMHTRPDVFNSHSFNVVVI
jgi:hypothetical protein